MDNAATSFPKAPGVSEAVVRFMEEVGASPGRGGHYLSHKAEEILWEARTRIADLLGAKDPSRVIFTLNVTYALNMALYGLLSEGDHVVTTSMEHNSVMRPLSLLERIKGVSKSVVQCSPHGELDPDDLLARVTPSTRLIVMTHASNVTGGIMPVREVAEGKGETLLLLDAAQTTGSLPVDMEALGVDILAFTGHKGLLGPTGVGGLCIAPHVNLPPVITGGTGTTSESIEPPDALPWALEAGTPNTAGLAGLVAALKYLNERGIEEIRQKELSLTERLIDGLSCMDGIRVYGPQKDGLRTSVVSLNVEGIHPDHLSAALEAGFGILTRPGLHCAPLAHKTLGTFPEGTLRISPGPFTEPHEIDLVLEAMENILRRRSRIK
jgi:cysteine desulfurase family protein